MQAQNIWIKVAITDALYLFLMFMWYACNGRVASRAGTDSGHLKNARPVSRAFTCAAALL
eukprot:3791448-Pleurochrysis_carterae.AAC.1